MLFRFIYYLMLHLNAEDLVDYTQIANPPYICSQLALTRLVKIAMTSLGRPVGKGLLQSLGLA
ncbi:hypothetical protein Lepto7375DRAFT_5455 [Leptolyngbya sp. PCC 7375]|nr:hypothetical protein Lepto7375DRAFT_5455 [Leptolyngbya sp. PCC 7375]